MDFIPVAERIVDAILEAEPYVAAEAGDHRFDDRLPDFSPDGTTAREAMLRDASRALSQVDLTRLDPQELVDHEILMATVERGLFELTEMRAHEWDPLRHNPGPLLHALIARPYAPVAERLTAAAARLKAIPDALAVARSVLRDCPRIHLETAAGQFAGTAALIRDGLPPLLAQESALRIEPHADAALSALDEFTGWLRGLPAGRDPRLGRRLWEARLWHTLDSELTAAQIHSSALENLDRITSELRSAAAALTGGAASDETVRLALGELADQRPDDSSIVDLAKLALEETTAFVAEHELVSLIDDPCIVQEMPAFARGVSVAYCDPPGPLETEDVPTFYFIEPGGGRGFAPTPLEWTSERIRQLTVHEAMPGHFLQFAAARRFRGPTRARALGFSGPFVEGWAVYATELMADHGYGGLPFRVQQLRMQLLTTINALLDQLIHCEEMPESEAMSLMMDRGFQEEVSAVRKWRRALLTSTQLSTYFVGYTEVSSIARERPAGTSLRAWHDAMLSHGSPSPRHVRNLILSRR